MTAVLSRPTLPASLRLSITGKVRKYAAVPGNTPLERDIAIAQAIDDMLRFLDRCGASSEAVGLEPPSVIVDEAWHAFIVHTNAYATYCQHRFGRFIHHRPNFGNCDTCQEAGCAEGLSCDAGCTSDVTS